MIEAKEDSKKFKNGKGIFDLNFQVKQGEVFGFIGPNGAGKSTTIRHLMGFLKPDKGRFTINGHDCWSESEKVKESIGYLPGEIVFPAGLTAKEFIDLEISIHNGRGEKSSKELIDRFELNTSVPIKRMSKGMKQKLAIVSAFMIDPDVIILDEPSTGLDPLMQKELINLFVEEKNKGKTIFLSSHIFEEIETIADTICIIKNGHIVKKQSLEEVIEQMQQQVFVRFKQDVNQLNIPARKLDDGRFFIVLENNQNEVLREIAKYDVQSISIEKAKLCDVFEKYYRGGTDNDL